ncbi:hypothetical protein VTN00DRAFT_9556 [Thermoascus crustaceus]|uniref:uncharacterized protein n=1 Tax=Thermoascus crustaceus TaxID=5088 RepID=UPI003743E094
MPLQLPTCYPLRIEDLWSNDLKLLTFILHTDITSVDPRQKPDAENRVRNRIDELPLRLRDLWIFRLIPNFAIRGAKVCEVHRDLNRPVIHHIFRLVRREVGEHLNVLKEFQGLVGQKGEIVRRLCAIEGMWTMSAPMHAAPWLPWDFQTDKCEACMLARIAANQEALENLRIVLLSRNPTRSPRPPPRLIRWVEACMGQYSPGEIQRLWYDSSKKAYPMKDIRKMALRLDQKQRRQQERRKLREKSEKKSSSRMETTIETEKCMEAELSIRSNREIYQHKQPKPIRVNSSRLRVNRTGNKPLQGIYGPGQSYIAIHNILDLYARRSDAMASLERLLTETGLQSQTDDKPQQALSSPSTPNLGTWSNTQSPLSAYHDTQYNTSVAELFENPRAGRKPTRRNAKDPGEEYRESLPKFEYSDSEYSKEE